MILLSAVLLGLCVTCISWFVFQRYQSRTLLADRLSGLTENLSFPFAFPGTTSASSRDVERSIALDDSYEDKITRDLYLAGFRNQKNVRMFNALIRLALVSPLVLILVLFLSASLDVKTFIYSWVIGSLGYMGVHFVLHIAKAKRRRAILRAMPQFFDLLVVCIEAGLNFTAALPRVIEEFGVGDPLSQEFELMHHEYLGGLPLAQSCDRLSRRCEVPDLSVILSAIVQSEQMGSALANTLRVQASELRDKLRQRMRERAHQIPIKILFPLMLIFVILFIVTLGPATYKLKYALDEGGVILEDREGLET